MHSAEGGLLQMLLLEQVVRRSLHMWTPIPVNTVWLLKILVIVTATPGLNGHSHRDTCLVFSTVKKFQFETKKKKKKMYSISKWQLLQCVKTGLSKETTINQEVWLHFIHRLGYQSCSGLEQVLVVFGSIESGVEYYWCRSSCSKSSWQKGRRKYQSIRALGRNSSKQWDLWCHTW